MKQASWVMGMAGSLLMLGVLRVEAGQTIHATHPLSANGRVRVEIIAGTVTIRAWDRDEVNVDGVLADGLKFDVSGSESSLLIRVEWPEKRHRQGNIRDEECRLEVHLPAGAKVETESVSGSVDVSGVSGPVDVETVSGAVQVAGNPDKLEVEVVSGDIDLDVGTKRVKLEAVSGAVRARTGGGEFEASVVSGDITLEGESFEWVDLESVSGDIEFTGALEPTGRVEISNHSGDVDLVLRGTVSAAIEVSTFSGSIRSELGGEPSRTSEYAPGEEYAKTIGDGSGRISIDAFSGTVRLRRL